MCETHFKLIEALIFASNEPVDAERLIEIIGNISEKEILSSIEILNRQYEETKRSFRIIKGGGGFRFVTQPEFSRWVKRLVVGAGRLRLSRAALETVSLIAYRQPITRSDIENVRGVDVGGVLKMLHERKLIKVSGRSKRPGRPLLYSTTTDFLCHFGIDSLNDLPKPDELMEFDQKNGSEDSSSISEEEGDEDNVPQNIETSYLNLGEK